MAEEVFELEVNIPVSLEEAETIVAVLDGEGEYHLSEHVKFCIQEAKQKAGFTVPNRK